MAPRPESRWSAWMLPLGMLCVAGCAGGQMPWLDPSGERFLVWPQTQMGSPSGPAASYGPAPASLYGPSTSTYGAGAPANASPILQPYPQAGPASGAASPSYVPGPVPSAPTSSPSPFPVQKPPVSAQPSVRLTGPAAAAVGDTVIFRIEASNPTTQVMRDVVVTTQKPYELAFISSSPSAASISSSNEPHWRLGDLRPGERRFIDVTYRAERPGSIRSCATVQTADAQTAQACTAISLRGSALDLRITGPSRAEVGSSVQFQVHITNTGDGPLTGLVITDSFDEGLEHSVAKSPVQRELTQLGARQTETVNLTFRIARQGRLCHTVEITGAQGIHSRAEACIEGIEPGAANLASTQPAVSLQVTGPQQMRVGEVGQFMIELANTGETELTDLTLTDNYDRTFEPRQASDGFQQAPGQLTWPIPRLAPGQKIRRQVNFEAKSPVTRACSRAVVSGRSGLLLGDEACVEVLPAFAVGSAGRSSLSIAISESADPVRVGDVVVYQLRLTNSARTPEKDVTAAVTVPAELRVERLPDLIRAKVDGQRIEFAPIAAIQPGETITLEFHARAMRAGEGRLRAEATGPRVQQALAAEENTRIFAGQ